MITLTSDAVSLISAEWKELAVAVVAGYGTARAWFSKEIAAGKVALKSAVTSVDNETKKIVSDIKTDASKVVADIKKI